MKNERSYKGMLVEVIVNSYIKENLFKPLENLKAILQKQLNLNLKFKTNVSDIEIKDKQTFGNISFDDENGVSKLIDFTITNGSLIV